MDLAIGAGSLAESWENVGGSGILFGLSLRYGAFEEKFTS